MIQRTYPEDEDDLDYYHFETSEMNIEFDCDNIVIVAIDRERFKIEWSGSRLEIGLNLTNREMKNLEEILESRFKDRIRLKK